MKNQPLVAAIRHLATERGLPTETVLEALEVALVSAYKRNYGVSGGNIQAQVDPVTGEMHIYVEKEVVEEVTDPRLQVSLAEARDIDPQSELEGSVTLESTPDNFGRIAAQTAKQVIMQRIREAERENTYEHFSQREGEIVSGRVQRFVPRTGDVIINVEQSEGVLRREDQLPNERYHRGSLVRAYLMEVKRGSRGTILSLSRTHRHMLRRLLENEVPEISKGIVEIKALAREPGHRSKVAVAALQPGVEPVGCCVGMRGNRIQNIVVELNGEKIDVIAWSADTRTFIRNALSPAKPLSVLLDERDNGRTAVVIVPDRQLSLSIGREGQNARLAAKLTGWRIDIKGDTEAGGEGLLELARQQVLAEEERKRGLLETVQGILREGREAVKAELEAKPEPAEVPMEAEREPEEEGKVAAPEATEAVEEVEDTAKVEEARLPEEAEVVSQEVEEVAPEAGVPLEVEELSPEAEVPPEVPPEVAEEEDEVDLGDVGEASFEDEGEDEDEEREKAAKRRRDVDRRRHVVYDEELGQTIAIRRRKRGSGGWDEGDEYL